MRNCKMQHCVLAVLLATLSTSNLLAQGIMIPAAGAVNRGMGGATTGTAVDAIGSMYWNPATIGRFDRDEFAGGFELIYANQSVSSTFPAAGSGMSDAETGALPVPTLAWVHQTADPNVKFGLGVLGVGGFAFRAPANAANPIFSPAFAAGGAGVGALKAESQFFQISPAFSLKMTDRLTIGFGPVAGLGRLTFDENAFASPNANGFYPRGDGTRYHWGMGAQLGFHFIYDSSWEFGANLRSPIWFEAFRFESETAAGLPRVDKVDVDLPMILSGGLAYRGMEDILLTLDLRYFNYSSAEGFGDPAAYDATGAAMGLGWKDLFSLGLGAQLQLTDALIGRIGYVYASELFDESATFFNVSSNIGYRHMPTVGASLRLNENAMVSIAYNYAASWGASGPYVLPGVGPVNGSSVTTDSNAHSLTFGINTQY